MRSPSATTKNSHLTANYAKKVTLYPSKTLMGIKGEQIETKGIKIKRKY